MISAPRSPACSVPTTAGSPRSASKCRAARTSDRNRPLHPMAEVAGGRCSAARWPPFSLWTACALIGAAKDTGSQRDPIGNDIAQPGRFLRRSAFRSASLACWHSQKMSGYMAAHRFVHTFSEGTAQRLRCPWGWLQIRCRQACNWSVLILPRKCLHAPRTPSSRGRTGIRSDLPSDDVLAAGTVRGCHSEE
jgi:hypothetical protein